MLKLLRPPIKQNVAEWADTHRYIARGTSSESGKFNSSRLPYQVEPMEMVTDPHVGEIVLMMGAQLGKTEMMLNVIGYMIDAQPSSILFVLPTTQSANKFSTKKLAPCLSESPVLKSKVKDPRSRDSGNTILSKDFPGGSLILAGSNSPASLRQVSCRVVLADEIDAYTTCGTEGDAVTLADQRAANFHDAILIRASTPTIKGASRIESYYEKSDQRRWYCPCPKCGKHQVLKWSQVKWPKDKPEEAVYVCEFCEAELTDHERVQMVQKGEWRAENPGGRSRGYHLSGLNRIMGRKRQYDSFLHEFVDNFLQAKARGRESLMVWVNTFLCETWEDAGDRVESEEILKRCENYNPSPLPKDALVLTAGADVQRDRIECEVIAWGASEESWGIEYRTFYGDPERPDVWKALDIFLCKKWPHPNGASLPIACTCIDSGHATKSVYEFTKPRQARRVFAVKGSNRDGAPLITRRFIKERRVTLYFVGGATAKDSLFARLKIEEPGPRFMHFPTGYGYDEEFFRQLTAEEIRTKKKNGFAVRYYKKIRERNEALDCRVYGMAALEILNPNFERLADNLNSESHELEEDQPAQKPSQQRPQRGAGFVDAWR